MSANRWGKATEPAELVLGFGNISERAIRDGVARVGELLCG